VGDVPRPGSLKRNVHAAEMKPCPRVVHVARLHFTQIRKLQDAVAATVLAAKPDEAAPLLPPPRMKAVAW
jgi:hypothetical protein